MKKIILSIIMILSFITIGLNCYATTDLIPLQEAENYKGMSIIPEGTKNGALLIDLGLLYNNSNNSNLSFTINSNECYIIVCRTYLKNQNGVSDLLTIYNDRTLTYLISNNDDYIENNNYTYNNTLRYFYSIHCVNMINNRINIDNNINMFCYDASLNYSAKYYLHCLVYIPSVNSENTLIFENNMINNTLSKVIINYMWLYQYQGVYSYYNCNAYSMSNNIVKNNYGYNVDFKSSYILQGANNLFDLIPCLSQFDDNYIYSMYQKNYLYGFFSTGNKSFSNNLNGYFDLYAFGNNGQYALNIFNDNNIYNYDDANSAISSDYFNTNFNYFAYCYTCVLNNYYGANTITLNNLQINNSNTLCNSYFKDNTNYYTQNVGETNNTDLASDLGITYINCNWWNLKGQLNNLIYYIITGLPFLNNLYALCLNIFNIGKIGFNFFTWSLPLASLLCFIIAIRIVFDKMMK